MGLYEAAKDALKVAQQIDNVDLVQKLLDVQKMALEMQAIQQNLHQKINDLIEENRKLKSIGDLVLSKSGNWLEDPADTSHTFCPVCAHRNGFRSPLSAISSYDHFCQVCKWHEE